MRQWIEREGQGAKNRLSKDIYIVLTRTHPFQSLKENNKTESSGGKGAGGGNEQYNWSAEISQKSLEECPLHDSLVQGGNVFLQCFVQGMTPVLATVAITAKQRNVWVNVNVSSKPWNFSITRLSLSLFLNQLISSWIIPLENKGIVIGDGNTFWFKSQNDHN